jgi:hypothetical protein
MEKTVQFIAKNIATRPSIVTKQLEKKSVGQIGTEKTVQRTANTTTILVDIFIAITHQG